MLSPETDIDYLFDLLLRTMICFILVTFCVSGNICYVQIIQRATSTENSKTF